MKCEPEHCPIRVFSDLTPAEQKVHRGREAENLFKQGFNITQIAKLLGVDKSTISRDLELLHDATIKHAKTASNPKGAGRPKGTKKPGEEQKQRSVNAEPEVWEQFKKNAEAEGKSPAAKLGELIREEPQIDALSKEEIERRIQERVEREFPAALQARVDAEFTAHVEAAAARELEKKIAIAFPYYEQKIQVFDDWRANKAAITPQQLKIIDRAIREPEADARERALAILDDIVIRGRLCGDLRPASHGGRKRS